MVAVFEFGWLVVDYTRGSRKRQIQSWLASIAFGLVIVIWSITGWRGLLGALVASMITGRIINLPARKLATYLLSHPPSG